MATVPYSIFMLYFYAHFKNNWLKRMRKQATDWKKIFATGISDKRLLPKIYNEPLKLNDKKQAILKNGQKIRKDSSPKEIYR